MMRRCNVGGLIALLLMVMVCPLWAIARDVNTMESDAQAPPIDWSTISTLDLKTAVTIALSGNPGLEAAVARVRQAKAQVDQARSTYWPRVDASASAARVDLSQNSYEENLAMARFFNPNATIDNPDGYYNADLTASWTLFDGFERKFSNLSARYGESSSAAALKDAQRLFDFLCGAGLFQGPVGPGEYRHRQGRRSLQPAAAGRCKGAPARGNRIAQRCP